MYKASEVFNIYSLTINKRDLLTMANCKICLRRVEYFVPGIIERA